VRVLPPCSTDPNPTAAWTTEGRKYLKECQAEHIKPIWIAGLHYKALPSQNRVLLPDIPCLDGLQNRWLWERRARPIVPVWNFAKMPRPTFSPEENARLLSVYMRPWTLDPADVTADNPLLTDLAETASGPIHSAPDPPDEALGPASVPSEPVPKRQKAAAQNTKKYSVTTGKNLCSPPPTARGRNSCLLPPTLTMSNP
jgi:hypothetical protein